MNTMRWCKVSRDRDDYSIQDEEMMETYREHLRDAMDEQRKYNKELMADAAYDADEEEEEEDYECPLCGRGWCSGYCL